MNQMSNIHDLIDWIENNLHRPLPLDEVAVKSGYTKWHLQRLFKYLSGYNLAEYIRARRLSTAAIDMRLSRKFASDISIEYGYESLQAFSRTFKKRFGVSPGRYRDQQNWHMSGLCPPLNVPLPEMPVQPGMKRLPDMYFIGITSSFIYSFDELASHREQKNINLWKTFLEGFRIIPSVAFGLSQVKLTKNGMIEYRYFMAVNQQADINIKREESIKLDAGEYLCFIYYGQVAGFNDFINSIYLTYLPTNKVVRRNGPDIELFYLDNKNLEQDYIKCDYYIPVAAAS